MVKYINTLKDLEMATYGIAGANNELLKAGGLVAGIHTGHDDATALNGTAWTSSPNLYNVLYGQKVWSMLNQEVNPLSILPKKPYTSSGWRVMTARPAGGTSAAFSLGSTNYAAANAMTSPNADEIGGVDENHGLSSTGLQPLAPTYDVLFMSPKTVAHMFDYSELAGEMAKIDDGVGDLRALIREDMGKFHAETQSVMLIMPLEHYDDTNYANIERNYTSLMKIVASSQEHEAMVDATIHARLTSASTTGALTDDFSKLYGNTSRDLVGNAYNASFMDAQVDYGSSYAAADVRSLTLTLLNNMIQNLRTNGGTPKCILTGYDTIQTIADLLQSQERFIDGKEIIPTHNGVRGVKGQEVGFRVATYYDIPLIPAKDMPSTGLASTQTADLLFLDTDHLWLSVMKPTQYFESGISHGDPFGIGTLGNRGLYRTMGETGCSFFKGQGKITNVQ
tara:strand:+ start:4147 stop:5499 length:1353 start_codon:yes stop_codon:yes gene_type:complete